MTWTAPPPQWTPTGSNEIRTVAKSVLNGSTQVPLRWNYILSSGSLVSTTFSVRLDDGSFQDIGTRTGNTVIIFNRNDYRIRFDISKSEVATLIINKVTETEEAVYQCKLITDSNIWSYRIRVIVTGENRYELKTQKRNAYEELEGAVASWCARGLIVRSSPDRAVRLRALGWDTY